MPSKCFTRITRRHRSRTTRGLPGNSICCVPAVRISTAILRALSSREARRCQPSSGTGCRPRATGMPDTEVPVVQLLGVTKDYHGLRPLRIRELTLHPGRSLALMGLDDVMAGVLVDLLTAGSRPDTGDVIVFGESTGDVTDRERWLALLDRFGLISTRGVLLDQLTAAQNLAIPLSLEVD